MSDENKKDEEVIDGADAPETPVEILEETQEDESAKLKEQLLRTVAEFDNFRKRSKKEKDNIYPDAVAKTVANFIPIIDSFEMALKATTVDENYKKGFEMIYSQLKGVFEKLGVTEIEALGCEFNPELHNAVMHIEDDSKGASEIVEVLQNGYIIGEKVLRHAMVKVAN